MLEAEPADLPPNIPKHRNFENAVRHSQCRQWMSYEWNYDEIEDEFFHKTDTFGGIVLRRFPCLKTRNLTSAEWRKVRKLIVGRKTRRFSSKFVEEQRIELERFRRCHRLLAENKRTYQSDDIEPLNLLLNGFALDQPFAPDEFELYALIIEIKRLLALKSVVVSELHQINITKSNAPNSNDESLQAKANAVITKLRSCNEDILNRLDKLMPFQVVKDSLLFAAMDQNNILKRLSPTYFRRKCEVQIHESHDNFNSKAFVTSSTVLQLMNCLMDLALAIIKSDQLLTNAVDYLKNLASEHLNLLTPIMSTANMEYLQMDCLQLLLVIAKKTCA